MLDYLKDAPIAYRGEVYAYHTMSEYYGYCVIVSANFRKNDKYVSVISLTDASKDTSRHGDDVRFGFSDGREFRCHCGMITYLRRDRLDYKICTLSKGTMQMIDNCIKNEFGLNASSNISDSPEDIDYKTLYERLIKEISKRDGEA